MAIIDTGIDGNHTALDDLDDDNMTDDPKIVAFYDAINNPGQQMEQRYFPMMTMAMALTVRASQRELALPITSTLVWRHVQIWWESRYWTEVVADLSGMSHGWNAMDSREETRIQHQSYQYESRCPNWSNRVDLIGGGICQQNG